MRATSQMRLTTQTYRPAPSYFLPQTTLLFRHHPQSLQIPRRITRHTCEPRRPANLFVYIQTLGLTSRVETLVRRALDKFATICPHKRRYSGTGCPRYTTPKGQNQQGESLHAAPTQLSAQGLSVLSLRVLAAWNISLFRGLASRPVVVFARNDRIVQRHFELLACW